VAKQKIRTILIPESGIQLEPRGVEESLVDTDFGRTISHIVVQSPAGPVMVTGTTGGDIRAAMVGMAYELYAVNAGNAPDVYDAPNTFAFVLPQYVTDFLIETFGATISFRNNAGLWGNNKSLPVGFYSIDFIHYGVRIQNRVASLVSVYEITTYR